MIKIFCYVSCIEVQTEFLSRKIEQVLLKWYFPVIEYPILGVVWWKVPTFSSNSQPRRIESQWIVGGLVKGWFLRKKLLKGIMQHCKSVFDSYNTHYVLYILFLSSYQQMRSDWLLTWPLVFLYVTDLKVLRINRQSRFPYCHNPFDPKRVETVEIER